MHACLNGFGGAVQLSIYICMQIRKTNFTFHNHIFRRGTRRGVTRVYSCFSFNNYITFLRRDTGKVIEQHSIFFQ